jgi:hypothetical protein
LSINIIKILTLNLCTCHEERPFKIMVGDFMLMAFLLFVNNFFTTQRLYAIIPRISQPANTE